MPYKDPEKRRESAKLRQRKYREKPGVREKGAEWQREYITKPGVREKREEQARKRREDPEYVSRDRAKRKESRANPETRPARLAKGRSWKANRKQFFDLLKIERGCYDCGGMTFPPEVLEWDHLPGKEKCFTISKYFTSKPQEEVLAEISKCQLVCANCHRLRTINRKKEKI